MALTENKKIDKVEIVGNGIVQVREATIIQRDGETIATTYHRWAFPPNSDISSMPDNIQAIANLAWTPEVVAAYQAQLEALQTI
jgi:hypothetical protein